MLRSNPSGLFLFAGRRRCRRLRFASRFCRRILCWRALGLGRRGLRGRLVPSLRLADRQILPHLVQPFRANSLDGEKIIYAAKGSIGFPRFQDFVRGGGTDARDQPQLGRTGGCSGWRDAAAVSPLPQDRASSRAPRRARGSKSPAQHLYGTRSCHESSSCTLLMSNLANYVTKRFPRASYTSTSPNSAACSSICARSPTTTICILAESRYLRAVACKSADVSASSLSR